MDYKKQSESLTYQLVEYFFKEINKNNKPLSCILTITINTPDQRQSNINLYFWTNDTLSTTIILLCSALIDSVDQVLPTT